MSRRNRDRRPSRREPFKDAKKRILVVTEGSVTEPQYLKGLVCASRASLIDFKEVDIADEHGNDPKRLVGFAKDYLVTSRKAAEGHEDENLQYEFVWCAFDVDEHLWIPEAKRMAADNGIRLAISNPCIELWLLLHFRDAPGEHHRSTSTQMLKQFIPSCEKHVDYTLFAGGYEAAVCRAERLRELAVAIGEEGKNPSTDFDRLTELILGRISSDEL